jgi:hypothetical protein
MSDKLQTPEIFETTVTKIQKIDARIKVLFEGLKEEYGTQTFADTKVVEDSYIKLTKAEIKRLQFERNQLVELWQSQQLEISDSQTSSDSFPISSESKLGANLQRSRSLIPLAKIAEKFDTDSSNVEKEFDIEAMLHGNSNKVESQQSIESKIKELQDKLILFKQSQNIEEDGLTAEKEGYEDALIDQVLNGIHRNEAELTRKIEVIDKQISTLLSNRQKEEARIRKEIKLLEVKLKSINN